MNFTRVLLVTLALLVTSTPARAALAPGAMCRAMFTRLGLLKPKESALKNWEKIKARTDLGLSITDQAVGEILNDKDLPLFGERLTRILAQTQATRGRIDREVFFDQVRKELAGEKIPSELIESGIKELGGDRESLARLLGNLTFAETRQMYMGYESGLRIARNSLVGRYIIESGATYKQLRMRDAHTQKEFSNERMLVAVSAESFPIFQKYFSGKTMMSVFGHAGVYTGGTVYPHSGGKSDLRALSPTTPLPLLILKPSEAERLNRYMELAASKKYYGWTNPLKIPWLLPGYTQKGDYTCCTHWIGNMPIGDKAVSTYQFPNTKRILRTLPRELGSWTPTSETKDLEQVWKAPGNEQLSSVIGQLDKNVAEEFASPGYVIQTLFGPTSTERVPVVFYFMKDHREELPDNPPLKMEQPW